MYNLVCFFFFNDPATTEIYTLSLHDALPIWRARPPSTQRPLGGRKPAGANEAGERPDDVPVPAKGTTGAGVHGSDAGLGVDRKSTRLNSSHANISYAVFCLKKKTNRSTDPTF